MFMCMYVYIYWLQIMQSNNANLTLWKKHLKAEICSHLNISRKETMFTN